MGHLLLAGGAEFGGAIAEADRRAIELAGGVSQPIRILPTAAAPDNNHVQAGNNGLRWFRSLGAQDAGVLEVIDRASANDPTLAEEINTARLIYLLGGFPEYLAESLANSLVWQSALRAYAGGAVIAGSSAGAMVLCGHYYDPYVKRLNRGLNLLPNTCVLPHHNTFGMRWAGLLSEKHPEAVLIGIDEGTAMIDEASGWRVYGRGAVTLYRHGRPAEVRQRGEVFPL